MITFLSARYSFQAPTCGFENALFVAVIIIAKFYVFEYLFNSLMQ